MGGHLRLDEKQALFRVEADGQEQGEHFPDLLPEFGRLLPYGYGMQIRHSEKALKFVLHPDPVAQGAQIVAQRGDAGRLNTAQRAFFAGSGVFHDTVPPLFKCNRKAPVPCLGQEPLSPAVPPGFVRLDGRASFRANRAVSG